MDVAGHVRARHALDELVALLLPHARQVRQVEVAGGDAAVLVVTQRGHARRLQRLVVTGDDLAPALQHGVVAGHLRQTDRGAHVGHVALVGGADDVVLPGPQTGLGQGVLALPVKGQQHVLAVEILVQPQLRPPGDRATLCGGQVLHGMEAEGREVGGAARGRAVTPGTEAVGAVGDEGDTSQRLLDRPRRCEQVAVGVDDRAQRRVVAHAPTDVDRDDGLGPRGDGGLQGAGVQPVAAVGLAGIDDHGGGAHMNDRGGRGRVGVGRDDDLVSGTDAQDPKGQLQRGGRGVQAGGPGGSTALRHLLLQGLGARSGGDPARTQCIHHFLALGVGDVWGREINTHQSAVLTVGDGFVLLSKRG